MGSNRQLVRQSLALLPRGDRIKYRWVVAIQMATSVLDLFGVMLFGVVGVLAASASQGAEPPSALQAFLELIGLGDVSTSTASLILAAVAALLLISKSVVTLVIARRVTRFLARCSAQVSARMSSEFFSLPLVRIQHLSSQESGFSLSYGVNAAIIDVLNNSMIIWVEATLMIVLGIALLAADPVVAVAAIAYFGLVVLALTRWLAGWSKRTGRIIAETDVAAITSVHDGIATYREVTVAGHREFYARRFRQLRWDGSRATSDQRFIAQIPKYGLDIAMVLGAGLLVGLLLSTQTIEQAVGTLALFLTAASRVMPSLLRLHGARLALNSLRGRADYAFRMVDYIDQNMQAARARVEPETEDVEQHRSGNSPTELALRSTGPVPMTLDVVNLAVRYPESDEHALQDVSMHLPAGASLALVGPSGAGKTTLADAILGVVDASAGYVLIGGESPHDVIRRHPGVIAYVPQTVALVSGTVRENVALGVEPDAIEDDEVWDALRKARLADFLEDSREGIHTEIGERGVRLSGGQRQRLGIARALYSRPRLLVLDEATSALDADTENLITSTLDSIGGTVTTVTVAHRLATIRRADVVMYLEGGRVLASGTFDEVRQAIPQFDHQANLLGL